MSQILAEMKTKVSNRPLKVIVDDDSILLEALSIYKDPTFDASRPLRVVFSQQPAIIVCLIVFLLVFSIKNTEYHFTVGPAKKDGFR